MKARPSLSGYAACGTHGRGRKSRFGCGAYPAGNFGDCKPVGEGVSELRVDMGTGYRVYYGKHGQALVILLCGGDKGSQQADITRAKAYWADWKRRNS